DVLAVIANDVVLERRTALLTDAFEPRLLDGAEDFSDVLTMKHRTHAGHFLGGARVESEHPAVGNGRLDGHGIQQPGEVGIGPVLRRPGHFLRAVHARRVAADWGRRRGLLWRWHVRPFCGIRLSPPGGARAPDSAWPARS